MLARDAGVKCAYLSHVRVDVARRVDDGADATGLRAVIEVCQHDGDIRAPRQVIEPRSPTPRLRARALGRHNDDQLLVLIESFNRLRYQAGGFAALDRDAAQPPEDPAERPSEQGVLAHPVDLDPERERQHHRRRKLPVRRVGSGDYDAFWNIRHLAFPFPPEDSQMHPRPPPHRGAQHRRIEDRILHFRCPPRVDRGIRSAPSHADIGNIRAGGLFRAIASCNALQKMILQKYPEREFKGPRLQYHHMRCSYYVAVRGPYFLARSSSIGSRKGG